MSHNSTAKTVRLNKEAHPEKYCINRGCLHRAPCPKHTLHDMAICPWCGSDLTERISKRECECKTCEHTYDAPRKDYQ